MTAVDDLTAAVTALTTEITSATTTITTALNDLVAAVGAGDSSAIEAQVANIQQATSNLTTLASTAAGDDPGAQTSSTTSTPAS